MIDLKASRRYAHALFELSVAQNQLEATGRDFQRVVELTEKHPEITHLVLNSTISKPEKEDFIDKIFGAEISRLLLNFIKVLIEKRRFSEIKNIQKEFHRLFEKKQGIQEVEVQSAVALSQVTEQKLIAALEKKLRAKIILKTEVVPGMLGGLIIRLDGKEIDQSFRNRLQELKQMLLA